VKLRFLANVRLCAAVPKRAYVDAQQDGWRKGVFVQLTNCARRSGGAWTPWIGLPEFVVILVHLTSCQPIIRYTIDFPLEKRKDVPLESNRL
jgi:hypothetical protein